MAKPTTLTIENEKRTVKNIAKTINKIIREEKCDAGISQLKKP